MKGSGDLISLGAAIILGSLGAILSTVGLLWSRRPMRFQVACLTGIACGIAATIFGLLSAYHLPDSALRGRPEQGRGGPAPTAHEDNASAQPAPDTSVETPLPFTKPVPPSDILSKIKRWGSFSTRYGIRLVKRRGSERTEQRVELSLGDILVTGDEQAGQAEQATEILAPRARQPAVQRPAAPSLENERIPIPGLTENEFAGEPRARIRRELFRGEPARYVVIEMKMDYSSKSLPLEYLSWNSSGARDAAWAPVLADQNGNLGRLIRPAQHSGHFTVQPNETIREILVFEAPAAEINLLRLVLPCGVFGADRNRNIGIEIPLPNTNLDDTQE
ncbi:MAG: hypothetical protein CMJ62_01615 [Planctomycetaceae bacterium]|nr:hypothetical protein [Planctomycetaceae bacterium]